MSAILVGGVTACTMMLPERYSVNAPIANTLFGWDAEPPSERQVRSLLHVPDGFAVNVYAAGISNARILRFSDKGDLLVSAPRRGRIMLLKADRNGDGKADGQHVLIDGLNGPHGIDIHDGHLYVAEAGAIGRIVFDAATGAVSGPYEHVVTGLPSGGNHWTRTVRIGPDGKLYVSVGSSCNVCIEEDPRRAAILRFDLDGENSEIFATGLRNSVDFDWRPEDGQLYAVDNGRDLLGDNFPPEELNRIVQGGDYGWPYAHGENVPDPEFGPGAEARIADAIPQLYGFSAHMAPLGIHFIRQSNAPGGLAGAALVAFHGSWNRSKKDGYKVVSVHWSQDGHIIERDFLWGFLKDEDVIGRPVSVAEGPDGAFYVSDDYTGSIYRVAWGAATPGSSAEVSSALPVIDRLAEYPESRRRELSARGGELYATGGCGGCHSGQASEGRINAPELKRLGARYGVEDLLVLFEKPPANMPPADLSPAEAEALAVFLLSRDK